MTPFKNKEEVKAWYKKWKVFWIIVSIFPMILAGIKCISDGSLEELKYGFLVSIVFTIITVVGYHLNVYKAEKYNGK
jgi:phosphatidylglycerophosphate synthase